MTSPIVVGVRQTVEELAALVAVLKPYLRPNGLSQATYKAVQWQGHGTVPGIINLPHHLDASEETHPAAVAHNLATSYGLWPWPIYDMKNDTTVPCSLVRRGTWVVQVSFFGGSPECYLVDDAFFVKHFTAPAVSTP